MKGATNNMNRDSKFPPRNTKPTPRNAPNEGKSIAALIIALVILLLLWVKIITWFLSPVFVILAAVGIYLAATNKKELIMQGHKTSLATAALVANIIAMAINIILFIACSAVLACVCSVAAI